MNPFFALLLIFFLAANIFYGLEDHIGRQDAASMAVAAMIAIALLNRT